MQPEELIIAANKICEAIYQEAKLVKTNSAQSHRLAERVLLVSEDIKKLQLSTNNNNNIDLQELTYLYETLGKCLTSIKNFSNDEKWHKQVLKTGTYQKGFEYLNQSLRSSLIKLHFEGTSQKITNFDEDKVDLKNDLKNLHSQKKEISRRIESIAPPLQKLQLEEKERKKILQQQLSSRKFQLSNLAKDFNGSKLSIVPEKTIFYFELGIDGLLGKGSFGDVYMGTWEEKLVTIKEFDGELTPTEQQCFQKEVSALTNLAHPNIVQLHGVCLEGEHACLVLERGRSTLYEAVPGLRNQSLETKTRLALDIIQGLSYLHKNNMVHRNLKSCNVILTDSGNGKITDFGLSKTNYSSIKSLQNSTSSDIRWWAPECFERNASYTTAADIYSFGIILWEIFSGKEPYASIPPNERISHVQQGLRETLPPGVPPVFTQLIESCWSQDPIKRPSAEKILELLENPHLTVEKSGEELYQQGIEAERKGDLAAAYSAYQQSAEKNFYKAHTNLGLFFLKGIQVPQNKVQAYKSFFFAAERGHPRAMFNLALMLEKGDGIERNLSEAMKWYKKAADKGDTQAKQRYEVLIQREAPRYTELFGGLGSKLT